MDSFQQMHGNFPKLCICSICMDTLVSKLVRSMGVMNLFYTK